KVAYSGTGPLWSGPAGPLFGDYFGSDRRWFSGFSRAVAKQPGAPAKRSAAYLLAGVRLYHHARLGAGEIHRLRPGTGHSPAFWRFQQISGHHGAAAHDHICGCRAIFAGTAGHLTEAAHGVAA